MPLTSISIPAAVFLISIVATVIIADRFTVWIEAYIAAGVASLAKSVRQTTCTKSNTAPDGRRILLYNQILGKVYGAVEMHHIFTAPFENIRYI